MRTEKRPGPFRAGTLVLALILCLSLCLSAGAETAGLSDVTLMLAQSAVESMGLTDANGEPLQPRYATEVEGRGVPDQSETEPDYRGIVGFAALQTGWEVSEFRTFALTPWILPVYGADGREKANDMIRHKTPVLVVDQALRKGREHTYTGYLRVIRLDSMTETWIDAAHFATVPYWTLAASEAVKYGYCIAVYRDSTRNEPMDRKGHRGAVPDGTRVLLCYASPPKYESPDREHYPLLGIVFSTRNGSSDYYRNFLFFNPGDLYLIY